MSIKLIAIDIDGTLLNPKKQLTEANKEAIQNARNHGIKIVLCSGRPLTGVRPYLKKLNLKGESEYAITFNGAMAQDADGKVISHLALTNDEFIDAEALSHKWNTNFQVETTNSIYIFNRDVSKYSVMESFLVNLPIKFRTVREIVNSDTPVTKTIFIADPEKITKIKQNIPDDILKKLYVVQTEPCFLEMMNKHASKGHALKNLAKKLNLDSSNVMAIGDQGNDVSMVKYAGSGIAMGNGIPDVKSVANHITKTNQENGVAYAINHWALNQK
ncbi:sugar phosphate phosphatase [Philodulcilactobacillus myokoensis]|uniref:Sugar phosphate phosphatase n=1 Tax=Philodulcilactobacillus myokoensis TaxID=2929573 RepID=A0A9W6ESW9_9LACO|nr:sugar-phosphatase [Philodulcilactobacillus myokoensis]GLB47225.1 sugar phosphate phosphatase [Philodulcilactobacillus myokoensis]